MGIECPDCLYINKSTRTNCEKCGRRLESPAEDSKTETISTPPNFSTKGFTVGEKYRVIQELGRGGMGVVYKAEDSRLKRIVALKLITSHYSLDEDSRKRFIREAQAAAALNHPNICTVYEVDEDEENSYIAMEYIEGQNLREAVKKKPFNFQEILELSTQMAEGLFHAHTLGVIHRDIKSANVMVKKNNQIKIMDFGLAKQIGSTLITKDGHTIGTIAYMSPEQAKGKSIDFRTDIWSLGVVLFEVLSGQLPFQADIDQALIYSILNDAPKPLTSLRSGIPLEFEKIVEKCLEKDPSYRYQTANDLLTDLRRLKRDLEEDRLQTIQESRLTSQPKFRKPVFLAVIAVMAVIIIALLAVNIFFLGPRGPTESFSSELSLLPLTRGEGLAIFPSWSPDGTWIAYASDKNGNLDIWKTPVEGGESIALTSDSHDESQPAWSPDGRRIAFFSDMDGGGIYLIPADGGTPWRLTTMGAHPSWSPDNETLAFDWQGDIYIIPYTGGEPKLLINGTSSTPHTTWTPDGRKMIFWNRTKGDIFIFYIDEEKSKPLNLVPSGQEIAGLSLSRDGRELVFSRGPFGGNKDLWRVEIDPKTGDSIGTPRPISVTTTDDVQCAFSPDGKRVAFTAAQLERHLHNFPVDPNSGLISGNPKRITYRSVLNYYPALSPDGRMLVWTSHLTRQGLLCSLAFDEGVERKVTREWGQNTREIGGSFAPDGQQICYSSTVEGSYEVWRLPSLGSIALRLTRNHGTYRDPMTAWSPDGKTIAFYSNRQGNWDIWSTRADGQGEPIQLTKWESNENYPCWSPDSQQIAFRSDKEGNGDIWIMDADGKSKKIYVSGASEEGWSSWSPDGRWFYFISNRKSGFFNVWVKPTRGGDARQVTDYKGLSSGLPDFVLFTKFAVSSKELIIPLEFRKGNIQILENLN